MEFVVITYPAPRNVFMDGMPHGVTGQLLRVQRGHHVFDLGLPHDYQPLMRAENVVGTTKPEPMVVQFELAVTAAPAAPPSSRGRAPAAAPRRKREMARARTTKRASPARQRRTRRSPRTSRKK
jgi:hypothetical protein